MKIKITYCNIWNYKPKAFRMKDEILSKFPNANVQLIAGDSGNFIVEVENKVIFSKKETNRFPNKNEILDLI